MGGQDDRRPICSHLEDLCLGGADTERIEPAERLIHQEHARLREPSLREGQLLPHPTRELAA